MGKKLTFRWKQWVGFLLLIPSLILNILLFQETRENNPGIKVIGVIDGDTFVLEGKVRLRLRQIDAPELEFCGGKEAKEKLESLVKDKKVIIKEQILDQWGRPMALVYTKDVFVNEEMLLSGWAKYHNDQSSQKSALKTARNLAQEKGIGIFSPKCFQKENPENPKCTIKGNIDKSAKTRIYHFPGCAQYDFVIVEKDIGEGWFCAEEEAQKAGFERSKRCPEEKFKSGLFPLQNTGNVVSVNLLPAFLPQGRR